MGAARCGPWISQGVESGRSFGLSVEGRAFVAAYLPWKPAEVKADLRRLYDRMGIAAPWLDDGETRDAE